MSSSVLRVRWLGRVAYSEALALQESIFHNGSDNRLLLLEHPHVFTYGPSADLSRNLKCDPTQVGAEFVAVNRGGDITYHGPGQLVGYPLLTLPPKLADSEGPADSVAYVHSVEQMIIDSLRELGLQDVGTMSKYPGVWVNPNGDNPRKICAIGVRVSRRRTMHGFALNVSTDLEYMREHIVPCGISEYSVTSMHEEGVDVSIKDVADVVSRHAAKLWGNSQLERQDVAWKESLSDLSAFSRGDGPGQPVRMMGRLARAGVEGGVDISARKPDWIRPRVHHGAEVLALKKLCAMHR